MSRRKRKKHKRRSQPVLLPPALTPKDRQELYKRLGYAFHNPELLEGALSHNSLYHETPSICQRMEFLGDSVVGLAVAEYLYRKFSTWNEGDLTRVKSHVVSTESLATCCRKLGIRKYLRVGRGLAAKDDLPDSLYADFFESITGAIFLDVGFPVAANFVIRLLKGPIQQALKTGGDMNYKNRLQQIAYRMFQQSPEYAVLRTVGPEHHKEFHVSVLLGKKTYPPGNGNSKKQAEQQAAKNALEIILNASGPGVGRREETGQGEKLWKPLSPADPEVPLMRGPDGALLPAPWLLKETGTMTAQNETAVFQAGIDEAGYGPRLGPMCSAVVWAQLAPGAGIDAEIACERIQGILLDEYDLLIDDSKTIFHDSDDLPKLWLPISILAGAYSTPPNPPVDTESLLRKLCPESDLREMRAHPWYAPGEDFSIRGVGEGLRLNATAQRIRDTLTESGVVDFGIRVRVLSAAEFNRETERLGNKAEVNWSLTADSMRHCASRTLSGSNMEFFCDRHGGRKHYGQKLTDAFREFVWAVREDDTVSRYELKHAGRDVRVQFRVHGDSHHGLIALASMAAKLVREIWMNRFNRFFRLQALPEELKPTSGYHNDSGRFLQQVDRIIRDNGFQLDDLIRKL